MALITDHKISLNTLEVTSEPQSYELPKGPTSKKDLSYFQTKLENGVVALDLIVANMNCAGCM